MGAVSGVDGRACGRRVEQAGVIREPSVLGRRLSVGQVDVIRKPGVLGRCPVRDALSVAPCCGIWRVSKQVAVSAGGHPERDDKPSMLTPIHVRIVRQVGLTRVSCRADDLAFVRCVCCLRRPL
jgi:hypothetical protein